jgi:hypothetical protein
MKKRFLLPIAFLMVTTLSAQPLAPSSCADVCQKDALITVARSVANTFGPTYVAFLNNAQICLIFALVFVGLVSSLLVFSEALSASSSS